MKIKQKGFTTLEILLVFIILAVIGFVGYYVYNSKQQTDKLLNSAQNETSAVKVTKTTINSFEACQKAIGSKIETTYPEICVTKSGHAFTDNSQSTQKPYRTTLSKVPTVLQSVVVAKMQQDVPACIKDGHIVDPSGQSLDPMVDYAPSGSAITSTSCSEGAEALFVLKEGQWTFIDKTQSEYTCAELIANSVPSALLLINVAAPAKCFDSNNQSVTYND